MTRRCFNTQPPEGGWAAGIDDALNPVGFNTQPPEGGWRPSSALTPRCQVSTHSRPKAAGDVLSSVIAQVIGFNTQPPEGGWGARQADASEPDGFNTQPPEGGWHRCGKVLVF